MFMEDEISVKWPSVEHAIEVTSMFSSRPSDERLSLQHLRVRRNLVEGTNGHILLRMPIAEQGWIEKDKLIPADAALILARSQSDLQQELPAVQANGVRYPDTDKTVREIREKPVVFECFLAPAYLETIGKAFGMLGVKRVRMICRGSMNAVEFRGDVPGLEKGEAYGEAFQMPMM